MAKVGFGSWSAPGSFNSCLVLMETLPPFVFVSWRCIWHLFDARVVCLFRPFFFLYILLPTRQQIPFDLLDLLLTVTIKCNIA